MSCTGQWTHQHHVHLPMYCDHAQSVATKNKQPRSIFVLVLVLLSLDTFPYVSAANLVLLKLYNLVPQNKRLVCYRCAYCVCHCFPFWTNVGAG